MREYDRDYPEPEPEVKVDDLVGMRPSLAADIYETRRDQALAILKLEDPGYRSD